MAGIVNDDNIHQLVRDYVENRRLYLPAAIRNIPIGDWNVSIVTNMRNLFEGLTTFDEPLNNWIVSSVTNMESMFYGCTNFNQPLDNWNVSRVTNMNSMFRDCRNFNQDLSMWNINSVRNITNMFRGCRSLTINPHWQIRTQLQISPIAIRSIFLDTPLQGQMLEVVEIPRPPRPAQQPPRPAGVAFEIHNAFPELNFNKFMTIIRRDNNGASNFKDSTYPLQPLITYINNDTSTTLDASEKTNLTRDLNGEIKIRLNMYLSEHPKTKNSVMEMTQFVMSQGPDYKDPYIRFLVFDCMNAYGPGGASCTKGIFERVFLINKSVLMPLCSDDTSSSASSTTTCKEVYRELLGCFYPEMNLNALFGEWYNINSMEEGSTSPLANASEEERKEDFRKFVLRKVPQADPTAINKYIATNENTFKTLLIGGEEAA